MAKSQWYGKLTQAFKDAGCVWVRNNNSHDIWRGLTAEAPLVPIPFKINDGKLAHRMAKKAGVRLDV